MNANKQDAGGLPTEAGWYWHGQGGSWRPVFVCKRPGHDYLAVEDDNAVTGKRNFTAVSRMGGKWGGLVPPHDSTGEQCRAASVEDSAVSAVLATIRRERDAWLSWNEDHPDQAAVTTPDVLKMAADLIRALSRGVPEDAVGSHFYAACERACGELPDGWEVRVCLENGSGTVELCSPDGFSEYMDVDDDDRLTAEVNAAVDAAIAAQRKEG
jgi:hypothetical protein